LNAPAAQAGLLLLCVCLSAAACVTAHALLRVSGTVCRHLPGVLHLWERSIECRRLEIQQRERQIDNVHRDLDLRERELNELADDEDDLE
jgi:hypothetical protein